MNSPTFKDYPNVHFLDKTECVFDARFIFIVEKIRPAIMVMCISL